MRKNFIPDLDSTIHLPPEGWEEKWLDALIAKYRKPTPMYIRLTPALAVALKNRDTHNRKKRLAHLSIMSADVKKKNWAVTASAIAMGADGVLDDGGHRIEVVILTGIPIITMLVLGLAPKAERYADQHSKRTAGDVLAIEGHDCANVRAACAAYFMQWVERGRVDTNSSMRPTNTEIVDWALDNTEKLDDMLQQVPNQAGAQIVSRSIMGAFYLMLRERKAATSNILPFMRKMMYGEMLEPGDPVLLARERITIGMVSRGYRVRPTELFELLARAWNATRSGSTQTRYHLNGTMPDLQR